MMDLNGLATNGTSNPLHQAVQEGQKVRTLDGSIPCTEPHRIAHKVPVEISPDGIVIMFYNRCGVCGLKWLMQRFPSPIMGPDGQPAGDVWRPVGVIGVVPI